MNQSKNKQAVTALRAGNTQRSIQIGLFVVFGVISLLLFGSIARATSITEGFTSVDDLPEGAVVSISQDDPNVVELTNVANSAYVAGVAAGPKDGAISVTTASANLLVAVTGDSGVLVSTINGPIEQGDLLGPSAISGVAQRATVSDGGRVLGVALESFDGTGGRTETVEGQDIQIGYLPMRLLLTEITGTAPEPLSFLEKIGIAVTGSNVSTIRVIISTVLFLVAIFISGMMLFGSIKGTFSSIGRNPLASESIFSNLMHVTFVAAAILLVGVVAAYLVMAI